MSHAHLIVRKITVWSFNYVQINDWCLNELLLLNNNTWKTFNNEQTNKD